MFRNLRAPIFTLTIAALCFAGIAYGAASTVTWTKPATYTDGSALAASDITGNKIGCLFTPTGGIATACILSASTASGSASTFTANLTYPAVGGVACFTVIATAGGVDSAPSSAACKTFAALTPSPPTGVTVTVTITMLLNSASPISVAVNQPVVKAKQ